MSLIEISLNFKTQKCSIQHDEKYSQTCVYYHNEIDCRRFHVDLETKNILYVNILFIPSVMSEPLRHKFSQSVLEYRYHILNYKTTVCPYLEIIESCELKDCCPYIHPCDNLTELKEFREKINVPVLSLCGSIESCTVNDTELSFMQTDFSQISGEKNKGTKKFKQITLLQDGKES